MGDRARFLSRLERCKTTILASGLKDALIFHHDEADGLSSAALAKLTIERLGLKTQLVCLDKLYPEVVREAESGTRKVIAYVDLGSGHIDWLSQNNKSNNMIVAIDHHDTSESKDPSVANLNPELDGFSGEKDASSATIAYMFAKTVDDALACYSHLALIGSLEVPGDPQGLNLAALHDAEESKLAHRTGKGSFRVELGGTVMSANRAATVLNVLGSVGYYRDGPQMGVKACIIGCDEETLEFARRLEEERKEANRRMLATIGEKGLSQMKRIQWFHAHDNYRGMGGKVVGSFCSYLRHQRGVKPMKYLVGMMNVPPQIPTWGNLRDPTVKVSARVPQPLVGPVEKGT